MMLSEKSLALKMNSRIFQASRHECSSPSRVMPHTLPESVRSLFLCTGETKAPLAESFSDAYRY